MGPKVKLQRNDDGVEDGLVTLSENILVLYLQNFQTIVITGLNLGIVKLDSSFITGAYKIFGTLY